MRGCTVFFQCLHSRVDPNVAMVFQQFCPKCQLVVIRTLDSSQRDVPVYVRVCQLGLMDTKVVVFFWGGEVDVPKIIFLIARHCRGTVDCGATPPDLRRSTDSIRRALEQKALRYTPITRKQRAFSS